jgi:hypothetical protein
MIGKVMCSQWTLEACKGTKVRGERLKATTTSNEHLKATQAQQEASKSNDLGSQQAKQKAKERLQHPTDTKAGTENNEEKVKVGALIAEPACMTLRIAVIWPLQVATSGRRRLARLGLFA